MQEQNKKHKQNTTHNSKTENTTAKPKVHFKTQQEKQNHHNNFINMTAKPKTVQRMNGKTKTNKTKQTQQ